MGVLDSAIRSVANTVIAGVKIGSTPVTLRRTETVFDPVTSTTIPTETDYATSAVLEGYADSLVDGTMIRASDRKATIAASSLTVTPIPSDGDSTDGTYDSLVIGSDVLRVVNVKHVMSGDSAALFVLQCRR